MLRVAFTRQMVGTRDQITSGRRWKRVLFIPFIFSGSPNEFWPHTFDACVITNLEIRIAGDERSPQQKSIYQRVIYNCIINSISYMERF